MRLTLDTNILVRAVARPEGPAGELLDRIRAPHVLIISLEMLAELQDVLSRDRIRAMHHRTDDAIEEFLESLAVGSLIVGLPDPLPRVVPDDADDDVLVATAVAGNADIVCTRNLHLYHKDVLAYCSQRGIQIMDDLALLHKLRAEESTT